MITCIICRFVNTCRSVDRCRKVVVLSTTSLRLQQTCALYYVGHITPSLAYGGSGMPWRQLVTHSTHALTNGWLLCALYFFKVVGLPFGLHGVSLNTNMTKQQRQKAVEKISSGKVAVVLVSPEALVGGSSGAGCLPHPSKLPPIAFACIDEAHCVSEWSHNFRPSYLRVCKVCMLTPNFNPLNWIVCLSDL
jgi:hypothetical protein